MIDSVCRKHLLNLINSKKVFIFDFDGVLADSVEVKTDAFAELYMSHGKDVTDKVVAHHRANGGMTRFAKFRHYHGAFLGIEITQEGVDRLSEEFSRIVVNRVVSAAEIPGASDFLNKYHKEKECFVNSATPEDEVRDIVRLRGWKNFFKKVYGSPSSKFENLNKIVDLYPELNIKDFIFFGDALSDMNAAEKADMDFIGIGQTQTSVLTGKVAADRLVADFSCLMGHEAL